jgi:tRNA G37 N-methylase Trm5
MNEKKEKQLSFKDKLKEILSEEELKKVKTAFDVIGDIAILEIDDELRNKEEKIAKILLSCHKNINTVVRKDSEHKGKYRRQKMKYLAGIDKKETLHKENNTWLYVNVEDVYYSPRLANERKRIINQVKKDENVLVMFSGLGPYTTQISKNTNAKRIVGIEINPKGHKLSILNTKKNKLKNVELYNGDVNKILPKLIKKPIIGLKAGYQKNHLNAKFKNTKTDILEIYLSKGDLENDYDNFVESLKELKKKIKHIIIHSPYFYKGYEVCPSCGIKEIEKTTKECFDLLEKTCKKLDLFGFVAHPYTSPDSNKKRKFNGKEYGYKKIYFEKFFSKNKYQYLMIENLIFYFFSKVSNMINLTKKYNLKFCLDLAHLYGSSKTEEEFYDKFMKLSKITNYYHIADAKYLNIPYNKLKTEHSFEVGKGNINFNKLIPFIDIGICEVTNKDELNPIEMLSSYEKLNKIETKFDRILMPLPKSAEDFLELALDSSKKGTIIHFYDFLHEDEFDLAKDKIKKACDKKKLKFKILDLVKCGQHSPRTYRICVDFMII